MNEVPKTPKRWAHQLTHLLNTVLGSDHFPINVEALALGYSKEVYPDDPVSLVKGRDLPGFEGGLYRAPPGKTGWGIFYNSAISSPGRINFTLAHEFGHYLLHRMSMPDGISCGEEDLLRWDSKYGQVEQQANEFAATLLMPLDDYRRQIDERDKPSFEQLGACADRYGVSLTAVLLRWLEYTLRRACLVISRGGYVLWARSSQRAWKSGLFIKTAGKPPVPVPRHSLAAESVALSSPSNRWHEAGIWFNEECEESVLISDQYDFVMSLLHFSQVKTYEQRKD